MEKHKNYLKQTSIGFAGVLNLMKEIKPSDQLAQMLLKVFKCTGIFYHHFGRNVVLNLALIILSFLFHKN